MPYFDTVSELKMDEVYNAIDQANKEISTRFDFKGADAKFEFNEKDNAVSLLAKDDFFVKQMLEILKTKLLKRKIDIKCLEPGEIKMAVNQTRQDVTLRQGIDQLLSKKIVKMIKAEKIKVQAAIQGEKIRVTGKKKDDLQQTMSFLREADLELPLQFNNFHD